MQFRQRLTQLRSLGVCEIVTAKPIGKNLPDGSEHVQRGFALGALRDNPDLFRAAQLGNVIEARGGGFPRSESADRMRQRSVFTQLSECGQGCNTNVSRWVASKFQQPVCGRTESELARCERRGGTDAGVRIIQELVHR